MYFSLSKSEFSLKDYYKRRFIRILPEYWLILTILFTANKVFTLESFKKYIIEATTLGYWLCPLKFPYFLWYISAILAFYAIYPVYFKGFKKYHLKAPIMVIATGLILIIVYAFISLYFYNNVNFGKSLILTLSRIPVFFMGSIFGYWVKNEEDKKLNIVFVILIFMVGILSVFALYIFTSYFNKYLWTCSLYFIPFYYYYSGALYPTFIYF